MALNTLSVGDRDGPWMFSGFEIPPESSFRSGSGLQQGRSRKRSLVPISHVQVQLEVGQLSLVQCSVVPLPQGLPVTQTRDLAGFDRLPVPLQIDLVLALDKSPLIIGTVDK
jgi:hypothetical protein